MAEMSAYVLTEVVVIQVLTFIKAHQIVHLKSLYFIDVNFTLIKIGRMEKV